jgi:hypothetical protein
VLDRAATRAATSEHLTFRLLARLARARLDLVERRPDAARAVGTAIASEAHAAGLPALDLEGRLLAAEADDMAHVAGARQRLLAIEAEARRTGQLLIAAKAARAAGGMRL